MRATADVDIHQPMVRVIDAPDVAGQGKFAGAETCCYEAEGTVKITNWQYVGEGRGGYDRVHSYSFVGAGGGDFDKQLAQKPEGHRIKPMWTCLVPAVLMSALLYWLFVVPLDITTTATTTANTGTSPILAQWTSTTVLSTSPDVDMPMVAYNCQTSGVWVHEKASYCCKVYRLRCNQMARPPSSTLESSFASGSSTRPSPVSTSVARGGHAQASDEANLGGTKALFPTKPELPAHASISEAGKYSAPELAIEAPPAGPR